MPFWLGYIDTDRRAGIRFPKTPYNVAVTIDAAEDLNRYIRYLLFDKDSDQAAGNVLDDFEAAIESLKSIAGRLKLCDNPRLKKLSYHRINFYSHRYFMLYRIEENKKAGQPVTCIKRINLLTITCPTNETI